MKKTNSLLVLLLITSMSFAQIDINKMPKQSNESLPVNFQIPMAISKTPSDTLAYYDFWNYGQASVYNFNPYGYTFGTNWTGVDTIYNEGVAQGYLFQGGSFNVEEALIWVGGKEKLSTNGSSLIVKLRSMDSTSSIMSTTWICPGTTLRTTTIPWNEIDTSSMFTKAVFNPPAGIFGDFAVHVSFTDFYANDDTIGLVTGGAGSGTGINSLDFTLFKFYWNLTGKYYWAPLSFMYSNLDVALAIWPVVDNSSGNIDGEYFANGIKLSQNFPNPVNNSTIVEYEIEKNSEVILEILNIKGQKLVMIDEGFKKAGKYSINIDLEEFSSGTYYYSLKSGNQRLTKKMIVVK